ncbi:MAG: hypothetical protein IT497_04890 [Ottowia sp.]|nr:hypothetical protein [Ottowia sp.]
MGYKVAQIEELRKKISELPELDISEREVTKQEAVKLLAKEVSQLQKRGYSLTMIAEFMTRNGMEISVQTLKTYLTRSDSLHRKKDKTKTTSHKKTREEKIKTSIVKDGENLKTNVDKSSPFVPRKDSEEI